MKARRVCFTVWTLLWVNVMGQLAGVLAFNGALRANAILKSHLDGSRTCVWIRIQCEVKRKREKQKVLEISYTADEYQMVCGSMFENAKKSLKNGKNRGRRRFCDMTKIHTPLENLHGSTAPNGNPNLNRAPT